MEPVVETCLQANGDAKGPRNKHEFVCYRDQDDDDIPANGKAVRVNRCLNRYDCPKGWTQSHISEVGRDCDDLDSGRQFNCN